MQTTQISGDIVTTVHHPAPINFEAKYLTTPIWIYQHSKRLKLSPKDIQVFSVVYSFSYNDKPFFASNLHVADILGGDSIRTVQRSLAKLEKSGLIYREMSKSASGIMERLSITAATTPPSYDKNVTPPMTRMSPPYDRSVTPPMTGMSPYIQDYKQVDNQDYIQGVQPEKISRFIKPEVGEVKAYCEERKNKVDPNRFCDYYESNGWKVGKNPMKDWKASVRTWERSETIKKGKPKHEFENKQTEAYSNFF